MAGIAIKINILPFDALQLLNTLQVVEINLGDILNTLSSSMVAIGVLLVISGVLGCLGTWFESKCLIILVSIIISNSQLYIFKAFSLKKNKLKQNYIKFE